MQIGYDYRLIEGSLPAIMCLLEKISWHRRVRNNLWFLDPMQSEYQAMADAIYELVWIRDFLNELHLLPHLLWDYTVIKRQAFILQRILFFMRHTKHVEVDCHVVRQKVMDDKIIETRHVSYANQLANLLAKPCEGRWIRFIYDNPGMYDMLQLEEEF